MKNEITTRQVRGKGRGRILGFPTINLAIPKKFILKNGVYAVWVILGKKKYKGALHYGPIPTFDLTKKSLEVYLITEDNKLIPSPIKSSIKVKIIQKIRNVIHFNNADELKMQMKKDVSEAIISLNV